MVTNGTSTIVIIGAGPCGLACARELTRLGHSDWLILERTDHEGGLASSVVDAAGFTWDLGGHVVFSHFGEFDALLEDIAPSFGDACDVLAHALHLRAADAARVWLIPVALGPSLRLSEAPIRTWRRLIMAPYNFKVWATPPDQMAAHWIAERISVIDYERALRNVRNGHDDVGWGPNNTFVFPAFGGTGEIYRRVAAKLPGRIRYRQEVVEVDAHGHRVRVASGEEYGYGALLSTAPLDKLVSALRDCPDAIREAALRLRHNGVLMVGVGYEQSLADDKSWMYFPQNHAPFYRATNFAKYSPANVPDGDVSRYCAYMTETSYSPEKPAPRDGLEERVERGLRAAGVVSGEPAVASIHVEDIEYAYPVPTLQRDAALETIQPWLMERDIFSRGRFGAWRYEIANMDHSVKMGIDVARRLVRGDQEQLWW